MHDSHADIRALTFDVFGTVVDWRGSIAREAEELLGAAGFRLDWHAFAERWRARYQPAMEAVRSGQRPWTILDVLHHENLLATLTEFGVGDLPPETVGHLNRAWHRLDPWPEAVAGLNRLKRRYILATQSNGNVALIVNMAKRAGLPWDVILGAEVVGAYKPLPQSYQRAVRMLGLAPDECMMTAAHNDDLIAARGCGLRTAFVARPLEYGPNQREDLRAEHAFDVVADSLLDLADQLGC
jgi:2-haloacid dehalogenase